MGVSDIKYKLVRLLPISKVAKINRYISLIESSYKSDIAKLVEAEHQPHQIRQLMHSCRWEIELQEEELGYHLSQKLLRKARKMRLPVPEADYDEEDIDRNGNWIIGIQTGNRYLSEKGYSKLRSYIRKEIKERRDLRSHWVAWLSALTGLVGTLTGFIAVFGSNG